MTVPRWDANKWHAQHTSNRPTTARTPRLKLVATLAAVALCLGAAAVSASTFGGDEKIGICHATGSEQNPYVFLIVDRNGYEHGHHRHHDGDFFVSPSAGGCDGDLYVPEGNGTGNGNETSDDEPAGDAHADTTSDETADEVAGNETAGDGSGDGPVQNETVEDAPAGNETEAPADNSTSEPEPVLGDAWVRQTSWQQQDDVVLSITVGNRGDGAASEVVLFDSLPDVRRTWALGGPDASDCVLDGRELTCWFGELAPGETRQIELRSYTDRMPCGFSMTNTATVSAIDDPEARNDASSASILARSC